MKKTKMPGYEEWMTLYKKYEDKDLGDKSIREELLKDFEEISRDYWLGMLKNSDPKDIAESLAQIWCNDIKFDSEKEAAEEAVAYMRYASDRMNFNRWLRIRILLNYGIE